MRKNKKNWKKESVRKITSNFPIEQFEEKTGLSKKDILSALDNIEKRLIIRRQENDITFNYHLEEWI